MEALTFFSAMNRGQFREEQGIEGSSYCIFFAPMEELVTQDRMTGREDRVVLELLYGDEMLPGALRVSALVLTVFMVCNIAVSAAALGRMHARNQGAPPANAAEVFLDRTYPDQRLHTYYPNMRYLNG